MRKRLNNQEAELIGLEPKGKDIKGGNSKYSISDKEWLRVVTFRELKSTQFKEVKRTLDKKGKIISKVEKRQAKELIDIPSNHEIKRVSTNVSTGNQWVITEPKKIEKQVEDFDHTFIEDLIKKHIKPIKQTNHAKELTNTFDRLVFTDVHIGMDTNKDGYAMYSTKWDEAEIFNRLTSMVENVKLNAKSNILYIDDLGDYLDGWDGETTRKGHKLPQNMDNQKAFDVAVSFKVQLIDMLISSYDNIIMNNICEDNHAGSFGYIVNSAVKQICELKYSNVNVINHRSFINHYYVGKHCFVISHGKDSKNLKFGFKPVLDTKQIEKIDGYLKHNNIYKNSEFIEFSKGDSHQMIFDYATSDDFDYFNYPAFSPSSEWVQTNFKKGRSGYVMFNIERELNKKDLVSRWF